MAPTFLSLPGEIRNEIYGHLFDRDCCTTLLHCQDANSDAKSFLCKRRSSTYSATPDPYCWYPLPAMSSSRTHYYSAIIHTCKQLYRETHGLLYASIFFLYSPQARLWPGEPRVCFTEANLRNIRRLEICLIRPHPVKPSPEEIFPFLSLPALEQLDLITPYGLWMQVIADDSTLLQYITSSTTLKDVWMKTLKSAAKPRLEDIIVPMLRMITMAKDWICDEEERPYIVYPTRHDDEDSYVWLWHLHQGCVPPAPGSTRSGLGSVNRKVTSAFRYPLQLP